ncbi:MAG: hypothetical protein HY903_21105 [Deltaproteobacteria bacterium]|nr:hypothetical protein [Deltaproteobacteria bacterium]
MRNTSSLLAPLFAPTLQRVLGAVLLRPERDWYLSDLAAHLTVRPSSLQRVLAALTTAGILLRRTDGNRVYYRPDPACPIIHELTSMMVKTVALADPLRRALAPLARRIRVAFIHGSVAEGRERSLSDVDLIVVGDVANADLALALRPAQERLGREVSFTRYTTGELAAKAKARHHFVTSVLRKKRIFLIGGEDELEEAVGRPAGGG